MSRLPNALKMRRSAPRPIKGPTIFQSTWRSSEIARADAPGAMSLAFRPATERHINAASLIRTPDPPRLAPPIPSRRRRVADGRSHTLGRPDLLIAGRGGAGPRSWTNAGDPAALAVSAGRSVARSEEPTSE